MRPVEELCGLDFQDFGGTWCRYEYGVPIGDTEFSLQLAVRSFDGATWEQLEAYVGHPSSAEQLWWTFDLGGQETGHGGDLSLLVGGSGLHVDHAAEVFEAVRDAACNAVQSVTSALTH